MNKAILLAQTEKAARMIGEYEDFDHGHLIVSDNFRTASLQERVNLAAGILFHTQELINGASYGLDPTKRNILVLKEQEPKILPLVDYKHSKEDGIHANDVLRGYCDGGGVFFRRRKSGELEIFCLAAEIPEL